MRAEWLAFLSAVQFLTRLPVPDPGWEDGRLDSAAKWFPLVGVIVGAVSALVYWIGNTLWSGWIAAVLCVAVGVIITGALHEDGLADTADGIGGGKDKAKRLEIMRDSRIGSYGALALLFIVLLKLGVITSLSRFTAVEAAAILIAAHAVSRAGMTTLFRALPYARTEQAPLSITRARGELLVVLVSVAVVQLPIVFTFGIKTVAAGLIAAGLSLAAMRWLLRRSLGGWTGDGAGATQQLGETAFLLGAAAAWT